MFGIGLECWVGVERGERLDSLGIRGGYGRFETGVKWKGGDGCSEVQRIERLSSENGHVPFVQMLWSSC